MASAKNPFGAPPSQAGANPFASQTNQPSLFGQPTSTSLSTFGAASQLAPATNPFAKKPDQPSVFGAPSQTQTQPPSALGPAQFGRPPPPSTQPAANPFAKAPGSQAVFGKPTESPQNLSIPNQQASPFGAVSGNASSMPKFDAQGLVQTSFSSDATAIPSNVRGRQAKKDVPLARPARGEKKPRHLLNGGSAQPTVNGSIGIRNDLSAVRTSRGMQISDRTKQLSSRAHDYAQKIYDQLKRDGIKAPPWPSDPGNPNQRNEMERFKETYKKFRAKTYASLRKAGLIDDPEQRKKLEDAIDFKGICEDMCPEFEQVARITEFDVKQEEKEKSPDGLEMWPAPSRMAKKHYRSAAGQDAPLPMDVRSVDALRRTTDYLFDDLLRCDGNLPSMHNFLWDRTRAIRKDFGLHSTKTPAEIKEQIYCFENITRFHVTALHLLSRKSFAADDFDQKQEIEQLGNTLLTLIQTYDDCQEKGIECENEAEFRAYFIVLNAHDQFLERRIQEWEGCIWFEAEIIQTALSLVHNMMSVRERKGPLKPITASTITGGFFGNYFSIVEDPNVSYTMGCFAEIHFTWVRQHILETLVRSYSRTRDSPKTMTAAALNKFLRFDTDEEALEFAQLHDLPFSSEGASEPYLLLNSRHRIPRPRVPQSYSGLMVERKRTTQSLPEAIHTTIFEDAEAVRDEEDLDSPDSLFVTQPISSDENRGYNKLHAPENEEVSPSSTPPLLPGQLPSAPTNLWRPSAVAAKGTGTAEQARNVNSASTFSGMRDATSAQSASPFSFLGETSEPSQAQSGRSNPLASTAKASETPAFTSPFSVFPPREPPQSGTLLGHNQTADQNPTATPGIAPSFTASSLATSHTTPRSLHETSPFDIGHQATSTPATDSTIFPSSGSKHLESSPSDSQSKSHVSGPAALGATSFKRGPPSNMSLAAGSTFNIGTDSTPFQESPAVFPQSQNTTPTALDSSLGPAKTTQPFSTQIPEPVRKRDLMGDFTRWFVKGDDGVLDNFTEVVLHDMLIDVWDQHRKEEEGRRRKEEDERSWAEANAFKNYNLGLKYFYKWREIARALALQRRQRAHQDRLRRYREERKAREKAEKAKAERLKKEDFLSTWALGRRASTEDALRETGVFSGMRNADEAIWQVVNGTRSHEFGGHVRRTSVASTTSLTARLINGLRLTRSPSVSRPPAQIQTGTAGSPGGRKTQVLRELYGDEASKRRFRASTASQSGGANGATNFSQSLPSSLSLSSLSLPRKRSAEDDTLDGPSLARSKRPAIKTPYWDMRARGMVQMPNGEWLHDSIAKPMADGRRFAGVGDYGLGPSASPEADGSVYSPSVSGSERTSRQGPSALNSPAPDAAPKRKRALDEDEDGLLLAPDGETSPLGAKRQFESQARTDAIVAEADALLKRLGEQDKWFRDQNEILMKEMSLARGDV